MTTELFGANDLDAITADEQHTGRQKHQDGERSAFKHRYSIMRRVCYKNVPIGETGPRT